jgi:hypothetical protein
MKMQTDELRRELRRLADEQDPFEADLSALRGRERRRTALLRAVAGAVVVVVVAVGGAVALTARDTQPAGVAHARKEFKPGDLRLDLVVVPASPQVKQILEASPMVERYALLPRGFLPTSQKLVNADLHQAACALLGDLGYAVQAQPGALSELRGALGSRARVFELSTDRFDAEIFMQTSATPAQVNAVRDALGADTADVASYRFIDHNAAYAEFKRVFADQQALIDSTTPDVLPESFRIVATRTAPLDAMQQRFKTMKGVDTVILQRMGNGYSFLFGAPSATDCSAP